MTINTTTDVLIVIIPVLILGFIIGTGILRKFSRSFWFFVFGCAAGAVTLLLFEVTFATETIMLLTSISLNRFFGSIMGRNSNHLVKVFWGKNVIENIDLQQRPLFPFLSAGW
jgi:hypothetical protein